MNNDILTEKMSARAKLITDLAKRFSICLIKEIGTSDTKKAAQSNRESKDPAICASHDYCDANQVMIDAVNDLGLGEM